LGELIEEPKQIHHSKHTPFDDLLEQKVKRWVKTQHGKTLFESSKKDLKDKLRAERERIRAKNEKLDQWLNAGDKYGEWVRRWCCRCRKKKDHPDSHLQNYDQYEKHLYLRLKKSEQAKKNWDSLHAKLQIFRAMHSYLA